MLTHIKYISDFDELTWTLDISLYAFYECSFPWETRCNMQKWIQDNCKDIILIWNGLLQPNFNSHNWGNLVSPDNKKAYFIFLDKEDEVRFCLEFINNPNVQVKVHQNGWFAYHNRLNNPT